MAQKRTLSMSSGLFDNINEAQKELLRSSKYAGLTVRSGSEEWKCHQAILCQRCPFFEAACGGAFKEAEEKTITLEDETTEGITLLLTYLYTLEVPIFGYVREAETALFIGDKFELLRLRDAAYHWLLDVMGSGMLERSWLSLDNKGKGSWLDFIDDMWAWGIEGAEDIRKVTLKDLVNISPELIEHEDFQELIHRNKDLAIDLFRALSANLNTQSTS